MTRSAQARPNAIRGLQRRPYRYALALVLACASLVALILLYADRSVSLNDKFTQIGAGLAASIIFAVIYTVLANREYAELIRAEISDQLTDHLNDILHQIKQFIVYVTEYDVALDPATHSAYKWLPWEEAENDLLDSFTQDIIKSALRYLQANGRSVGRSAGLLGGQG